MKKIGNICEGHPNTLGFVWAAMSIIKFHCEEAFTRKEVTELKNLLVGRWKPYSTFLMAASIIREAKTPDGISSNFKNYISNFLQRNQKDNKFWCKVPKKRYKFMVL